VIAVGPEGGFTAAELKTAEDLGFLTVGLGPAILRVETAAIAAATLAVAARGGFD
jgi:16S rRNA (uracil1498-N3)-methyltransferase